MQNPFFLLTSLGQAREAGKFINVAARAAGITRLPDKLKRLCNFAKSFFLPKSSGQAREAGKLSTSPLARLVLLA